ncbi:unconventional prefoldin RPB5 interactor-like protein [Drosophila kikkawai]|uniref:Unconventional prefoldin RPB5 interactor-like protein n=1 Tax=Drosophila kikkawai TaxID=30033 RepID=A0A6P4IWB3_DROKI|nr:unconventional prefoldin RPB5 interactor-like protein [Drosophila kikkawai]
MNRQREDILRQAIDKNAYHTERWQAFKSDNESTIRNLDLFSQKLSVDIMVPIGKKALMPGELIHTNELLVGHYEGYFSACSAHKAKEICRHRIKLAEESLKQLETEADLWQNKLKTPLEEGAVPSGDQVEIVEDFNEESHNKWMAEHKERVRQQKQEERLKRQAEPQKGDNEVLKKLEEREMMEELGLDPDDINEDMLEDLLNGEKEPTRPTEKPIPQTLTDDQESQLWEKLEAQEQNETEELSSEAEESLKSTDNLVRQLMSGEMDTPLPKKRVGGEKQTTEGEDDNEDDDEEVTQVEEVKTIREQISLLPSEERQAFLRDQLNILKAKMRRIQKANFISDELIHLMNVVVVLEDDLQDMIFEQELEDSGEDGEPDETVEETHKVPEDSEETVANELPKAEIKAVSEIVPENGTKTRRISFALSDEKLEFRREDTVAEMLPNARKNSRDVIKLDEPLTTQPASEKKPNPSKSTNEDILQKVQRNIEFVKENQSVQDFDLLNQILEASTGRINTLHISFKHSDALPSTHKSDDQEEGGADTPGNPADFYKKYEKDLAQVNQSSFPIYVNGFEGEEEVKVPIMSEAARGSAYEDPRSEFSKPIASQGGESTDSESTTKSILRNKSAVEMEPRVNFNQQAKKGKKGRKQRKKERTLDDDLRDMSAYQKVMHDLVEKEEPTAPEPLPKGKFIDAHTPKKRVSRFKEQRAALSKT